TLLVANLHATNDPRAAEPEVLRAAVFADSFARPEEPLILAGDFNLDATSGTLAELTSSKWGFSAPGPGIDHILVRGATPGPLEVWSLERRRQNGRVLSDHAPVELSVDV